MRTLLSLKLAYRHVRVGIGRMTLTILAVALGVALVVAIRLMNATVLAAFLDTVDDVAGRAALSVTAGEGLTFPEEVAQRVAAVSGVELAAPLVRGVAFPDDDSGELLTVYGVDLANDAAVRVYHRAERNEEIIDDLLVFLSQPDSIVLGREFAARRGLTVGSRLPLVTPAGVKVFTVRGLLQAQGIARTLGGRLVVMDVAAAELVFTTPGHVNQVDIVVAPGFEIGGVQAAVSAAIGSGLRVEEPAERKAGIQRTVGGFQAMLTALALLAVVAGFVTCYSRLGAVFEARTWEVGLLRAVGLRRAVVFGELLKESLLLGVAGTSIGVPLGLLIGRWGLPVVARATALNFRLPVPTAGEVLSGTAAWLGVGVGLTAAALAALVPALRLARKQPVAALTMRGREFESPQVRDRRVAALALLGACVGLVLWQQMTGITALGNVTTGLVAISACALARPLVLRGGQMLSLLWHGVFGTTGRFAAGHVRQRAQRASLTVATLGIGLGTILMFGMLGWSFERTLVSQVATRLKADLVLTSPFVSGGWVNAPLGEQVLGLLRAVPGIAIVTAEQRKDVTYRSGVAVLDSYDPDCFRDARVCLWPLEQGGIRDAMEIVARGDGAIVSSAFANEFRVQQGEVVSLDSPQGAQMFRVVGVTRSEPTTAIIMSRERYRRFWGDEQFGWAHVVLAEHTNREQVEAEIRRRVGQEHRLQVRSGAELIEYFASQARQGFQFLYLMEAIIFGLLLIGVGDTLATGVIERTRQFGMMRAVGLHRSQLIAMVVLEGLAIGVLGLLLAMVFGLVLGTFWVEVQFPALVGWQLDFAFPSGVTVAAVALTVMLCLAGSLLPSIRAARLSIPAALRDE